MGDFFGHLKDTKWLEWKAWVCACCCPGYVFAKVCYEKAKEDSYRVCVAAYCPCIFGWWYMTALPQIPDSVVNRILACLWTYCCTLCAVYVAAAEDGVDPLEEAKACIELLIKVITIQRS